MATAGLRTVRSVAIALALAAAGLPLIGGAARAQAEGTSAAPAPSIADHVADAAQRFGVPEDWIYAVMRVESANDPTATSRVGAMGLMQVMPATYAGLRGRYGLGPDPYAPRDNILAGAAYLREMYDRFGAPGFLAAYNAGPGRYLQYLAGRPLPSETRTYLAVLSPQIGSSPAAITVEAPDPLAWRRAAVFVQLAVTRDRQNIANEQRDTVDPTEPSQSGSVALRRPPAGLFVALSVDRE